MKKYPIYLGMLFIVTFTAINSYALDIKVETVGPKDLAPLKQSIKTSILARCISKGVDVSMKYTLEVSIYRIGNTLSFDAILDTKPPRAFHKDLKTINEIPKTLDEMVNDVFIKALPSLPRKERPPIKAPGIVPPRKKEGQVSWYKDLPIGVTSVTILRGKIFLSDNRGIYTVDDNGLKPWWKAPKYQEPVRLYTYKDSIIALVKHTGEFLSYRIRDGKIVDRWLTAVIKSGDGLISARLIIPPDITQTPNRWTAIRVVEGNPYIPPEGSDLLSTMSVDVIPDSPGPELITLSKESRLEIKNRNNILYMSDNTIGGIPTYLEAKYWVAGGKIRNSDKRASTYQREQRYYLPPRIIVTPSKDIITFSNGNLLNRLIGSLVNYSSCRILSYKWSDLGMEENTLARLSYGYCADISLYQGKLLAVITNKKKSKLIFIKLQPH